MKKFTLLFIFFVGVKINFAQNLHITIFGGAANYQGDLQDKRFTFNQAGGAVGIGVLYEITDNLFARANITYAKINGNDKYNLKNAERNLSFSSPITDFHLGAEYLLLNPYENSFAPYIFAGLSYFAFNPSALDSTGRKVFLQPLSTEGQGFYQNRTKYNLGAFAIPFGGGVKFSLSENVRIGIEIGMRKTFTDYLDDVSTTYVDQNLLIANRGFQAASLAFRGGELKTPLPYPADGSQRGSSKFKDWYYFTGVNLMVRLPGGNGGKNGGGKYKTGCPTNF